MPQLRSIHISLPYYSFSSTIYCPLCSHKRVQPLSFGTGLFYGGVSLQSTATERPHVSCDAPLAFKINLTADWKGNAFYCPSIDWGLCLLLDDPSKKPARLLCLFATRVEHATPMQQPQQPAHLFPAQPCGSATLWRQPMRQQPMQQSTYATINLCNQHMNSNLCKQPTYTTAPANNLCNINLCKQPMQHQLMKMGRWRYHGDEGKIRMRKREPTIPNQSSNGFVSGTQQSNVTIEFERQGHTIRIALCQPYANNLHKQRNTPMQTTYATNHQKTKIFLSSAETFYCADTLYLTSLLTKFIPPPPWWEWFTSKHDPLQNWWDDHPLWIIYF